MTFANLAVQGWDMSLIKIWFQNNLIIIKISIAVIVYGQQRL